MIRPRPAAERGLTQIDWLDSRHTFSFNQYYDPEHMGFRGLRVINDDRVAPGAGFGMHGHRDMEILTWMLAGEIEHRDSSGGGGILRAGELQYMCAGTGIRHSEMNPSLTTPVHLLQIWIQPDRSGYPPGYAQRSFAEETATGGLRLIASPDGAEGSMPIHQDAKVLVAKLGAGDRAVYAPEAERGIWIQVGLGAISVNGTRLVAGDGAAITGESSLNLEASEAAELLLFDLK